MSYFLPRLESGWHVDQAILAEESRVVCIRFGHYWSFRAEQSFVEESLGVQSAQTGIGIADLFLPFPSLEQDAQCMAHDETLLGIAEKVKNFAVICTSSFSLFDSSSLTLFSLE
jgi:DIM1 family U5 snRNP protein